MKHFIAIMAALAITAIIGGAMFLIGGNALLNTNTLPILNSPTQASASRNPAADPPSSSGSTQAQLQAQIQQLQSLVSQYQSREQQYQSELNTASQQLQQAQAQLQQYQAILVALQNAGIIRIDSNGQISVGRGDFR